MFRVLAQCESEDPSLAVRSEVPLRGGDERRVLAVTEKVQVLPLGIPSGVVLVETRATYLMQLARGRLPDEYRVHPGRHAYRERQVASPRGPAIVIDPAARFVRDLLDFPAFHVEHVRLALLVGECNALGVGRPSQSIQPPPGALGQSRGFSSGLIDDIDLLLTGPIRDERDPAPVRGPCGQSVVRVG